MNCILIDLLRDDFIEKDRSCGIYFTQDWVSMPGVLPIASGGIHVWHMPTLTEIFGDEFGRDLALEGNEIIHEARKWSLELAAVCEVWKAIKLTHKSEIIKVFTDFSKA
ncbi:hypothetical protein V6Z11_A13G091700 [Gossypium hirsutum]